MTLKPIKDQIITKRIENTNSPSGIILPEVLQKNHDFLVVAVGPEVKYCKEGDVVTKFFSVKGEKYSENGIDYVIFQESKDIEFVESK